MIFRKNWGKQFDFSESLRECTSKKFEDDSAQGHGSVGTGQAEVSKYVYMTN